MAFQISHTPIAALGQAAITAGKARGQQIKAAQDIQLTSMALAARGRSAANDRADRAQNRSFAIQQAAAKRMAKQRPSTPDTLSQRRGLQQAVSEAEASGVYGSAQIKQMQILANLGDKGGVQSILGKLPKPTMRRQELGQQLKAVTEIGKSETSEFQRQLDVVNTQLGTRFTPGTQRLLQERPEYMATVSPDVQELLTLQQQLEKQIATTTGRTTEMRRMLQLGLTIPEQLALQTKQETRAAKQEETEYRRVVQQTRESGKLTDQEELAIDVMRDREREQRIATGREIARLSKTLIPFDDEDENDDEYAERIKPIQARLRQLELSRISSFGREKNQIETFLRTNTKSATPIVTDATGHQWRFTGQYQNGKPLYEEIE